MSPPLQAPILKSGPPTHRPPVIKHHVVNPGKDEHSHPCDEGPHFLLQWPFPSVFIDDRGTLGDSKARGGDQLGALRSPGSSCSFLC